MYSYKSEQKILDILKIIKKSNQFIMSSKHLGFKLFKRSEVSPYARCFVIFNKSLSKQFDWLEKENDKN